MSSPHVPPLPERLRTTSLPESQPRVTAGSPTTSSDTTIQAPEVTASPSVETPSSASSGPSSGDDDFPDFIGFRQRGQTSSSLALHDRLPRSSPAITIEAAATDMRRTHSASASLPSRLAKNETSDLRGRSLSPPAKKPREPSPAPSALETSWWGPPDKPSNLPWKDQPKRKHSLTPREVEGYGHTKQRVALAVRSCLGNAVDVGHELLSIGVDLLELAPVPGLAPIAKTLLNIWDAVEGVDVNFNGCLRLTERCAEYLISIREEVRLAGDTVQQELHAPLSKLEESYVEVLEFMRKQVRRPFLKRFLKRDEILNDINACDAGLRDAMSLFATSVQIRTLKQVQETERKRQEDTQQILNTILSRTVTTSPQQDPASLPPITIPNEPLNLKTIADAVLSPQKKASVTHFITTSNALGLSAPLDVSNLSANDIISVIASLQETQNSLDRALDISDLRALMQRAIQTSSDAEIVDILQVKHEQMPDAIKTLQRALEVVGKRNSTSPVDSIRPGVVITTIKRQDVNEEQGGLQRSKTHISIESTTSSKSTADSATGTKQSSRRSRDTLEQEFIENGISALVRMSQGRNTNLPSWTITKFEVNREKRIGVGGFSDVYRGTWKNKTVAIKVLKLETEKKLFIREVEIWKTLHHPHVLELYGASSALEPPWFFVSPYLKNGNLVDYLRKVSRDVLDPIKGSPDYFRADRTPRKTSTIPLPLRNRNGALTPPGLGRGESAIGQAAGASKSPLTDSGAFKVRREWDLFRFMHEIAKGMDYLHGRGVLHGDMKAANVLVDDDYRCVITDFGQSEMKSTAFRLSGRQPSRGTLRWQAPEVMSGDKELTREADVYAFAIACVEIINMGKLPWGILLEDETIRNMVLKENSRPSIQEESRFNTPSLKDLLRICWHRDPAHRPSFSKISTDLKQMRRNFDNDDVDTPKGVLPSLAEEDSGSPTPDMRTVPLPPISPVGTNTIDILQWGLPHPESTVANDTVKMPEAVFFTSAQPSPSRPSEEEDAGNEIDLADLGLYSEDTQLDQRTLAVWNERRYRLTLTHEFSPYLVLPLWRPSAVVLGAVGYLSKPRGEFITLFNAMNPEGSEHLLPKPLRSIADYGKVGVETQSRGDKRTIAQKGWDSLAGLIKRKKTDHKEGDIPVSRRITFPLRAGHVSAHICTQGHDYMYMAKLDPATQWFKAHINILGQAYPHIQREDFCLVIGLVKTSNYGLFVSHSHPDGHVHFNVYKSPKTGQPWGTFTTDTLHDTAQPGPSYEDLDTRRRIDASVVSKYGGPADTVLISRLRFRADKEEPTWRL